MPPSTPNVFLGAASSRRVKVNVKVLQGVEYASEKERLRGPADHAAVVGERGRCQPHHHLATAVRGLMHGTATAGQIGWVLLTSKNYTQILASSNRRAPSSVRRARKVSLSFFVF